MSQEVNFFQIEIPKRAAHCMQGKELLEVGMEYYSLLIPDENKEFKRYDYCLSCWESRAKENFSTMAKTAWKAKIASKKEVEDLSDKTRDEKAFFLLKNALADVNSEEWAESFILALYLARRRIIFLRQEIPQEDGSTLCIYEVAATEEMLPIKRKALTPEKIQEIQLKLALKLNSKKTEKIE